MDRGGLVDACRFDGSLNAAESYCRDDAPVGASGSGKDLDWKDPIPSPFGWKGYFRSKKVVQTLAIFAPIFS